MTFLKQPHPIICLVGSTAKTWQEQYRIVNRELCLAGCVVVTVSLFKTDVDDIEKYRDLLESIHFQKIDMADVVVLISPDAVGKHTRLELDYSLRIKKPIVVYTSIEQAVKGIGIAFYKKVAEK